MKRGGLKKCVIMKSRVKLSGMPEVSVCERQRRRVGGDDRAGLAVCVDLAIDVLLDADVFLHGLDDPVAIPELAQIVLQVAARDEAGPARVNKARGALSRCVLTAASASALRFVAPSGTRSSKITSTPASAICAAMPPPMTPAPMMATLLIFGAESAMKQNLFLLDETKTAPLSGDAIRPDRADRSWQVQNLPPQVFFRRSLPLARR